MNTREDELKEVELSKIEKLERAYNALKNKESKFYFAVANTPNPAASIYEIYFHGTVLKKLGYNVIMLTDVASYEIPFYVDKELTDLKHESMEKIQLSVGPEDVIVIPEIFSNVMEQTKNLPCIRVAFVQSIDYALNALVPSMDWSSFGIKKVLTTNGQLKSIIEDHFGATKFDISIYSIGIPNYFAPSKEPKRPVVSLVGRNANELTKIVKLFYSKYPHFSWISFDTMQTESKPPQQMRRKDFAERLGRNFAAVWIDRISSFGTFPLECMKAGTVPVAVFPDMTPEFLINREDNTLIQNSGVWTTDIYSIPSLLGDVVTKYLDDNIGVESLESMAAIASKYSVENSEKDLTAFYSGILEERMKSIETEMLLRKESLDKVSTTDTVPK